MISVGALMLGVRLVVRRHGRVVRWWVVDTIVGALAIGVVVVALGGVCARSGSACPNRGGIVVVIKRDVGKRGLRQGLRNKFSLLVLEVGEIACSFFLGQRCSLSQTLLIPPFDDL